MSTTGKVHITYPQYPNGLPYNVRIYAKRTDDPSKQFYTIDGAGTYEFETGDYEFVYQMYPHNVLVGFAKVTPNKPAQVDLWMAVISFENTHLLNHAKWEQVCIEYQNPADQEKFPNMCGQHTFAIATMPPGVTVTATKCHVVTSLSVTVSVKAPVQGPQGFTQKTLRSAQINPLIPGRFYTWKAAG